MTFNLENPFRPASKRATKRLFGGERNQIASKIAAEKLAKASERLKVKYGEFKVLKPQYKFLLDIEDQIMKNLDEYDRSEVRETLIKRESFVFDDQGNLIKVKLDGVRHNSSMPLLQEIPDSISRLSNLEYFDFSDNALQEVPPEIGQLKKLKTLLLQDNLISFLPSEIYDLTNLEHLYLQGNRLTGDENDDIREIFTKLKILKLDEYK